MPIYTKWVLNSKLAELGIKIKTDHEIVEMTGQHVRCKHDGNITEFIADAVVCALGLKSRKQLTEELRDKLKNTVDIIPVGDTNSPRKIMQAVHEGFHAARRI
jgi:2,4-dienoyl-CoA reductase (NADPH2)